jgi:hypothetical protein
MHSGVQKKSSTRNTQRPISFHFTDYLAQRYLKTKGSQSAQRVANRHVFMIMKTTSLFDGLHVENFL